MNNDPPVAVSRDKHRSSMDVTRLLRSSSEGSSEDRNSQHGREPLRDGLALPSLRDTFQFEPFSSPPPLQSSQPQPQSHPTQPLSTPTFTALQQQQEQQQLQQHQKQQSSHCHSSPPPQPQPRPSSQASPPPPPPPPPAAAAAAAALPSLPPTFHPAHRRPSSISTLVVPSPPINTAATTPTATTAATAATTFLHPPDSIPIHTSHNSHDSHCQLSPLHSPGSDRAHSSTAQIDYAQHPSIDLCVSLCEDLDHFRHRWHQESSETCDAALEDLSRQARDLLTTLTRGVKRRHSAIEEYNDDSSSISPENVMIRRARNLGESDPVQTSYRRRTKKTTVGQKCHSCNTTDTPEWRRGPDGARTLCNACGLHYSKLLKRNTLTIKQANPYQSALPSPPPLRIIELQQSRHKRIAGMGLGEPHQ